MFIQIFCSESKNQEVLANDPESNGDRKTEMQAFSNAGKRCKKNALDDGLNNLIFQYLQHYSQFLRASQNYSMPGDNGNDSGDESGAENDLDSCNLPLNLVATQLGSDSSQH